MDEHEFMAVRSDEMAELNQLNKVMSDFISLHEWLEEKEETADEYGVLQRYARVKSVIEAARDAAVAEIRDMEELPGEGNRDRQDFEHLMILLQNMLSKEQARVMDVHLAHALEKVREQLAAMQYDSYCAPTRESLVALESAVNE